MQQVHYEVQLRTGDRWTILSAALSQREAVEEAAARARRAPGVGIRVVRERFNPDTAQVAARVVYERKRHQRRNGEEDIAAADILRQVDGMFEPEPDLDIAATLSRFAQSRAALALLAVATALLCGAAIAAALI